MLRQSDIKNKFPFLRESGHVVSLVGAGGKTTVMYGLARAYAQGDRKVIVTTTTHIQRPCDFPVAEDIHTLKLLLRTHPIVVAGKDAGNNKLKMPDGFELFAYQKLAGLILIEADGAKRLPCKAPELWEPVILPGCDIVLGVMGLDALGKPLGEVFFRKERVMEILHVDECHCMEEADLAAILSGESGTKKDVGGREYYVVLNKCDDARRMEQAERIRALLADKGILQAVYTSFIVNDFAD